jgi:hypothetical protein
MIKDKENKTIKTHEKKQKEAALFILGILFCALSLFLSIACLIYLFNWKQYLSGNGEVGEMGVVIARTFVKMFGLGALVIPITLFLGGLQALRPIKKFARIMTILILGAVLFSVTLTFIFHAGNSKVWLGNGLGGGFGAFIFGMLNAKIGTIGAGLLLLVLIIAYSLFITPKTVNVVKMIFSKLIAFFKKIFKRKKKEQKVEKHCHR